MLEPSMRFLAKAKPRPEKRKSQPGNPDWLVRERRIERFLSDAGGLRLRVAAGRLRAGHDHALARSDLALGRRADDMGLLGAADAMAARTVARRGDGPGAGGAALHGLDDLGAPGARGLGDPGGPGAPGAGDPRGPDPGDPGSRGGLMGRPGDLDVRQGLPRGDVLEVRVGEDRHMVMRRVLLARRL